MSHTNCPEYYSHITFPGLPSSPINQPSTDFSIISPLLFNKDTLSNQHLARSDEISPLQEAILIASLICSGHCHPAWYCSS